MRKSVVCNCGLHHRGTGHHVLVLAGAFRNLQAEKICSRECLAKLEERGQAIESKGHLRGVDSDFSLRSKCPNQAIDWRIRTRLRSSHYGLVRGGVGGWTGPSISLGSVHPPCATVRRNCNPCDIFSSLTFNAITALTTCPMLPCGRNSASATEDAPT